MLVREPRSTDATTICLVAWSSTTTAPATTPASRHARTAAPTGVSAVVDEIGDELPDDQQHDRPDHRAQVDCRRADPGHGQETAKEVEVGIHDVAHERQEDVQHPVVGDPREPAHQHPDEDQDHVDVDERDDVVRDAVPRDRREGRDHRPPPTTAATASSNAAPMPPRSSAASPLAVIPPGEVTRRRSSRVSLPLWRRTVAVPAIDSTAIVPASSGARPWATPASTSASITSE